ncbi:inovirus-type Gp2 protein [Chromohalobacter sp. 48-RD10]|uniref:YagK/YfjJ domain-containing protein n=1 Tax=Chromohalobacter sp. 48-RD10 TaxID=2994063 RepID=UPI002468C20F|nr:inovirus-type Gp2 protein [Chromohalobacter sp. 48-RD10]
MRVSKEEERVSQEWPECELLIDDVSDESRSVFNEEVVAYFKEVKAVVARLLEVDEVPFEVHRGKGGTLYVRSSSLSGKKLIEIIIKKNSYGFKEEMFFNSHPYVEAFNTAWRELRLEAFGDYDPDDQKDKLDSAVAKIRGVMQGEQMKRYLHKMGNAKRGRKRGAKRLIHSLMDKYARLEVVRLDLSYRKGKYVDIVDFIGALSDVKKDWGMFRQDMNDGVIAPGVVGYLAKLEYGLLSGFHFHVVVLFDGSRHREDIILAKMLGEYWKNQVVLNSEGRYYNCNRHKHEYRYLGIGTLNYYDNTKKEYLVNMVIGYMTKTDYVMASEAPGERSWFRSAHKVPEVVERRGRPRKFNTTRKD